MPCIIHNNNNKTMLAKQRTSSGWRPDAKHACPLVSSCTDMLSVFNWMHCLSASCLRAFVTAVLTSCVWKLWLNMSTNCTTSHSTHTGTACNTHIFRRACVDKQCAAYVVIQLTNRLHKPKTCNFQQSHPKPPAIFCKRRPAVRHRSLWREGAARHGQFTPTIIKCTPPHTCINPNTCSVVAPGVTMSTASPLSSCPARPALPIIWR